MADIKKLVEQTVREAASKDPWLQEHLPIMEWFGWQTEPWYQDPHGPFVKTFKGTAESVLGREVKMIDRAGALDSRFSRYFDIAGACTGPRAGGIHGLDNT